MRALALMLLVALLAGCSGAAAQAPPARDGLDLAVVRSTAGSPPRSEVLLVDADGPAEGRVVPSPEGVIGAGGLSWTPEGRLLMVGATGEHDLPSYRVSRDDLFTVAPDGGAPERLTTTGDIAGAVMSPDGATLAVARRTLAPDFARSGSRLWLMNADGGDVRPLLPGRPGRHDLVGGWSPDGRQIVFTRRVNRLGPNGELRTGATVWVVNADGTGAHRIAEGRSPAWSPDGSRIVFASARDKNGEISGGDTRRASAELYTAAPDGSDLRRITRTVADEDAPAWSSDGRWLAFRRQTNGPVFGGISAGRPDGSCIRPLAGDGAGLVGYHSPAWRPGTAVERDCAGPARHVAVPPAPVAGLGAARAFRGHPLYWLGPTWRGRRLIGVERALDAHTRYFFYGDCRTFDAGCSQVQYQIADVCSAPPPNVRGPLPGLTVTRSRIRGVPAFDLGFQWEVVTGRVLIRVFANGRDARRVIAGLRGLNGPAAGLRPGRPFPPPIPGALDRRLPCPRGG